MSQPTRKLMTLVAGAALLTGAPLAVRAQDAPPPPGLPPAPGAPGAPPPGDPGFPPPPGGPLGGGLGPGIPPPPPPPPLEAPDAPPTPAGPAGVGLAPGLPMTPGMAPAPGAQAPPTPDATPAAPKAVTLLYKFTPGQTVRYRLMTNVDGSVQAGGSSIPIQQQIQMTLHQTVKSVRASDGAATLAVQIDSMTMLMNGKAMPLPPQEQQQFKQASTLVMTPTGKVLSYQAFAGTPGMSRMSSLGLSPSDMQNARALPDKAVAQGDTWRSTAASEAVGLTTYALYTLSRVSSDGGTATVGQKLYGEFKPAKAGTAGAGGVPRMNGLMTGTGTEQFDIAAGQVAGQTADIQLKLTIATPGSASGAKTQFHITTDMERVGGAATAARPAPSDEPPTGQLQ